MMLVAGLPTLILLAVGWLTRVMDRSPGSASAARAIGASGAGLALVVTLMLWNRGVRGAAGTLDADPFSLYCSALLLGALFVILAVSKLGSAGISRLLISTVFLLLVVSTRDLLWIGVALSLLAMSLLEKDVSAPVGLAGFTFWAGAILLVSVGKGSDLAVIGASASSLPLKVGVGMTIVGVGLVFVVLNARTWALEEPLVLRGYLSAGVWIGSTTVWARVFAWLDVSFGDGWYLIGGSLGTLALVLGGLGVLFSTRVARLCHWFVLAQAGFAFVALGFGVEAVAPLLLHLACGGLALVSSLLALEASTSGGDDIDIDDLTGISMGRLSPLVLVLAWLSLASLPPFPGFVSKFPIFVAVAGAERTGLLAILLLSTMLVAVGCTRLISRVLRAEPVVGSPRPRLGEIAVAVLALGFTLVLGVLPESAIEVASRAAAGLF